LNPCFLRGGSSFHGIKSGVFEFDQTDGLLWEYVSFRAFTMN